MTKYVFVTGGVVSGLGKGIVAASLGRLLKLRGYKIAAQKLDPYMNVDPGTMNPLQHGEVFVTDDGAETDLDLGHYERFIDENLNRYSNLTSGKVFSNVLEKERRGEYLGQTVQIIPHVTDETKRFIRKNAEFTAADVVITEIGGTIGDIESAHFLEAIRQYSLDVGRENCVFIHVCLVPYVSGSNEYKTKPTQHSVKELQSVGIRPDIIVTRSDGDIGEELRNKIALFCNVEPNCVISDETVNCLYQTPIMLNKNGLDKTVCKKLNLKNKLDLKPWKDLLKRINGRKTHVKIALVGKYVKLQDSYISVVEALQSAGYENGCFVDIKWVDSEDVSKQTADKIFNGVNGIIIPGGFGARGIEGMIETCKYARTNSIPFFGICLGMQIMVMDYARNVCNIKNATSGEFDENAEHKVIDLMPRQHENSQMGGTMRLGSYPCKIKENTQMMRYYNAVEISERHRHRYEFNNGYRQILEENGLIFSGLSPNGETVETIELNCSEFFIGTQFHPEFKSRPNKAHPLFYGFVKSCAKNIKTNNA